MQRGDAATVYYRGAGKGDRARLVFALGTGWTFGSRQTSKSRDGGGWPACGGACQHRHCLAVADDVPIGRGLPERSGRSGAWAGERDSAVIPNLGGQSAL